MHKVAPIKGNWKKYTLHFVNEKCMWHLYALTWFLTLHLSWSKKSQISFILGTTTITFCACQFLKGGFSWHNTFTITCNIQEQRLWNVRSYPRKGAIIVKLEVRTLYTCPNLIGMLAIIITKFFFWTSLQLSITL